MNIYDISKKAGVSIATVSRVLNDSPHVSLKSREKVLQAMRESGYVPNAFARGLGLNSMHTIGLISPDAEDAYLSKAIACLESGFRAAGYDCILMCTGKETEERNRVIRNMLNRKADGMVLLGSSFSEQEKETVRILTEASEQMPVIVLNGESDIPGVYSVMCDEGQAMKEAAEYLIDIGCRRILYFYNQTNASGRRKLSGYRSALHSSSIRRDPALEVLSEINKWDIDENRQMLENLWHSGLRFDGVLASEDILAVAALKFSHAVHLRVPEDISIIGCNDSICCRCCEPELSSVDNRLNIICQSIVSTMLGVLQGKEMPAKTLFTGRLIPRTSCREKKTVPLTGTI